MSPRRRPPLAVVGERIRSRRLALNLSQEELADRSGLHRTYIGSLERGERNATIIVLAKVAAALETDAGELLRGIRQ
jgi:transcriptional regulator with XRE-family HTH domain